MEVETSLDRSAHSLSVLASKFGCYIIVGGAYTAMAADEMVILDEVMERKWKADLKTCKDACNIPNIVIER